MRNPVVRLLVVPFATSIAPLVLPGLWWELGFAVEWARILQMATVAAQFAGAVSALTYGRSIGVSTWPWLFYVAFSVLYVILVGGMAARGGVDEHDMSQAYAHFEAVAIGVALLAPLVVVLCAVLSPFRVRADEGA